MARARDVAAYIQARVRYDPLKLHKLLYYSQAWSLAWDGVPIFDEKIQAWVNGPVVSALWGEHKHQASPFPGDPLVLTGAHRRVIDEVVRFYGGRDGAWLSRLTHREEPWVAARGPLSPDSPSNKPITHNAMRAYYGQQAEAIGVKWVLSDELRRGLELLMSLSDDDAKNLFVESGVTAEQESQFLRHGGADPWHGRA